jgi:hypothetical protein
MSSSFEERDLGISWCLPPPEEIKKWSPIPFFSDAVTAPFGYYKANEDDDFLTPNEFELEALEIAKKHLKKYSYVKVAQWLSKETGRKITWQGLRERILRERNREKRAKAYRRAARRIALYLKRAREWEKRIALYSPKIEKQEPIEIFIPEEDEFWGKSGRN